MEEAIASVFSQTYRNIEVILADDGSTDGSAAVIKQLQQKYPALITIVSAENKGNCQAFNEAYRQSHGDFIIDLAADDVLMPYRIEKQINFFKGLDESHGVVFTDALYIDKKGKFLRNHFEYLFNRGLIRSVPQGDVYKDVLSYFFIASPTMMVKRVVFEKLDGYDETLAYEDFDFWVRSARYFKYGFLNEKLTKIRKTGRSMSSALYRRGDKQLYSTYLVCRKAMTLNKTYEDKRALIKRIRYELRHAVLSDNYQEAQLFYNLLKELDGARTVDIVLGYLNKLNFPMSWFRNLVRAVRS